MVWPDWQGRLGKRCATKSPEIRPHRNGPQAGLAGSMLQYCEMRHVQVVVDPGFPGVMCVSGRHVIRIDIKQSRPRGALYRQSFCGRRR